MQNFSTTSPDLPIGYNYCRFVRAESSLKPVTPSKNSKLSSPPCLLASYNGDAVHSWGESGDRPGTAVWRSVGHGDASGVSVECPGPLPDYPGRSKPICLRSAVLDGCVPLLVVYLQRPKPNPATPNGKNKAGMFGI